MLSHTAFLFANGEMRDARHVEAQIHPNDLLVAVDGGLKHIAALGRIPDVLIGDLDSVTPEEVAACRMAGSEVIRFPAEKDETDLELAVNLACERGTSRLVIVGATGGRLDQTLGNLLLLTRPDLSQIDACLDDGVQVVRLVRDSLSLSGSAGDTVSLIPLTLEVEGIVTEGLKYRLDGERLRQPSTRGISNVMLASEARVTVASGALIIIHTRIEPGME